MPTSLTELCTAWEKSNILPEEMTQEHISNLKEAEKSEKKIIKGRVHIDVMNTLVQMNTSTGKYECAEPIQNIVLGLLDAGKDVRLISSLPSFSIGGLLEEAGVDPRISALKLEKRTSLMDESKFGKHRFELLIDDTKERPAPLHATHLYPRDIVELANNGPS